MPLEISRDKHRIGHLNGLSGGETFPLRSSEPTMTRKWKPRIDETRARGLSFQVT